MATTTVSANVDSGLNEQAESVLAEIGLSVEDAVRMLLTQIVAEHCLPFAMHLPNEETSEALHEAQQGGGTRYPSLDALFRDMRE